MYRLIVCILFFPPFWVLAQMPDMGLPNIRNYEKMEYAAGTQNWEIAQDKDGFMYFANNDGILRFDGLHWDLTEVPLSLVRSVFVDSQNRVFASLISNFGLLDRDEEGKPYYKSLVDLVPEEHRNFNDVWKIHEIDGEIIFQSFEKIFIYDGESIKIFTPLSKFHFSFTINNELYYQELGEGLFKYNKGNPIKQNWAEQLKDTPINSILELTSKHILIGTVDKGLFLFSNGKLSSWNTEANEFVLRNKLFSIAQHNDMIALGTIRDGLVLANEEGKIIRKINRLADLQNNTVLSLFFDKDNNLWMGLDNGISYAEINSPLTYISAQGNLGTGYCAKLYKNKFYFGTNQGLFVRSSPGADKTEEIYNLIPGTEGQVWWLDVFDDQLLCGHANGIYIIDDKRATKISNLAGAWTFIPHNDDPGILLGGHYNGLSVLRNEEGKWRFSHEIKGFKESSRTIALDEDGVVWMSHGGKGIFRIELNEQVDSVIQFQKFGKEHGLPSDMHNILFKLDDAVYISTTEGIYQYQAETARFSPSNKMNDFFGLQERMMRVTRDDNGNVWYIANSESGVLRLNEDLSYTKITSPFDAIKDQLVKEFAFLYPFTETLTLFGIDRGFALYNSKFAKSYGSSFQSFITKVELAYINLTLYPSGLNQETPEFPFRKNSIRFHYNAPFYENLKDLRFSYLLENFADEWSDWSPDIYKEFTNLPYGNYVFKIKAINNYGIESETSEYEFIILPPWYRTRTAHTLYVIGLIFLLFSITWITRYRIKRLAKNAQIQHEKELEGKDKELKNLSLVAEKEIVRLRNDKLRAEMIHRDKELANQTNNIIQKNKLLTKLNQELQKIQNTTEDGAVKAKMAILKKRIQKEIDDKQQNRIFETYFDEVHKDFFDRLKEKFPQLSPKDLRLCAYIRMNISSKEIATLLNISFRGVEISRYRLRKKMELSRDINLSTFLSNI